MDSTQAFNVDIGIFRLRWQILDTIFWSSRRRNHSKTMIIDRPYHLKHSRAHETPQVICYDYRLGLFRGGYFLDSHSKKQLADNP